MNNWFVKYTYDGAGSSLSLKMMELVGLKDFVGSPDCEYDRPLDDGFEMTATAILQGH